jgi:molybdate transport system ATP-binding protein
LDWEVSIRKNWQGFTLDVQFSGREGFLGMLGASGSGKSMTLRCMAGLEKPDAGHIRMGDTVLFDSASKINLRPRERQLGYLFQHAALFPNMTAEGNVGFALTCLSRRERRDIVMERLAQVGMERLAHRYPNQLSGGQCQRVALARALVLEPDGLLLDEPFSALDPVLREKLMEELAGSLKNFAGPILLVTHQLEDVRRLCSGCVVLSNGSVIVRSRQERIATKSADRMRMEPEMQYTGHVESWTQMKGANHEASTACHRFAERLLPG